MGAQAYPSPGNGHQEQTINQKSEYLRGQDIKGKALVDIQRGEKLGVVAELLFDPETLEVAALASESGAMFNREVEYFEAGQIEVWGKDVILVKRPNQRSRTISGRERLVNLSDQMRGRPVVSTDGTRVGQVGDVLLDSQGRVAGYDLSQVNISGPLEKSKWIPVQATQSMGKDVLIVDLSQL